MSGKTKIIDYLLEKKGIKLPLALLNQKMVLDLERAISSKKPRNVSSFYRYYANKIDRNINIKTFFDQLSKLKEDEKFSEIHLSDDDNKIIKFLVDNTQLPSEDFLEMSGPIYFISQVADEITKNENIPKLVHMAVLMFSYVVAYELVLYQVDRRLRFYLKNASNSKTQKKFLKENDEKDYMKHAVANVINNIFIEILEIPENNNSIFGKSSKPKIIRNKVSHSNMFYDREQDLIFIGNEKYTHEEFSSQFYQILLFLLKWINASVGKDILNVQFDEFKSKIIDDLKNCFIEISQLFLKIERSGDLKREYMSLVVKWEKED